MIDKHNVGKTGWIIFFIYVAAISVLSFFHEFWRDELQSYMLVKNSNSISELIYNTRYEGHPSLWFYMLYGLKFIFSGLMPVKILHLIISVFTAWLIIKYSPFKILQKILLLAGYFFFYEYTFIIRNYAIGLFFLILFCSLFPKRKITRYFIFLALSVAGMMLSNFYSFFIGFACMMLLVAEHFIYNRDNLKSSGFISGFAIMCTGIILFIIDIIPPDDYGYAYTWDTTLSFGSIIESFARVTKVFVPIPFPCLHYWNSMTFTNANFQAILAVVIIVLIVFVFASKNLSRWFIIFIFISIMGFSYIKFSGYLRHNGHLYLAFIAMLWIQNYLPGKIRNTVKLSIPLLYLVLSTQVVAMFIAVHCEIIYTFSQAENTAVYIRENYQGRLIIADEDTGASSVCAFLDVPFYYPVSDRFGTYIVWDQRRLEPGRGNAYMVHKGDSLALLYKKDILYLTTHTIDGCDNLGLSLVKKFAPSVETVESYYIYAAK